MKKKLALLTGGSKEREVSFKSAKNIHNNLKDKYQVDTFLIPEDINKFMNSHTKYDLVIPMGHGEFIEDGKIIGLLEIIGKQYLMSSSETHAICMNKYLSNMIVQDLGFDTPKSFLVQNINDLKNIPPGQGRKKEGLLSGLRGKLFVKPNHGGSSVDTGVFDDINKAKKLIQTILKYDDVIIQQAIKGREFTVSIIGDYDKKVTPIAITEVITQREFFDFKAKYELHQTQEITPAQIDKKMQSKMENIATTIYKRFKIKSLSRIDFLYSKGKFYFLEINTIPGMTATSFLPQALKHHGYKSTGEFFNELIK